MAFPWAQVIPALGGLLASIFGSKRPSSPFGFDFLQSLPKDSPLYQFFTTGMIPGSGDPTTSITNFLNNMSSTTNFSQDTEPYILDAYKPLEGRMRDIVNARLAGPSSVPQGFKEFGVDAISKSYRPAMAALNNKLVGTGLANSPVAVGGTRGILQSKAGESGRFLAGIPLIERQLRNEDIGLASRLTEMFGKGMHSEGTSTTTRTQSGTSTTKTDPPARFDPMGFLSLLSMQQGQPSMFDNLFKWFGWATSSGLFDQLFKKGTGGGGANSALNMLGLFGNTQNA